MRSDDRADFGGVILTDNEYVILSRSDADYLLMFIEGSLDELMANPDRFDVVRETDSVAVATTLMLQTDRLERDTDARTGYRWLP